LKRLSNFKAFLPHGHLREHLLREEDDAKLESGAYVPDQMYSWKTSSYV